MHETMSGDINSLGHQLNRFSERNRHFRDFTLYSLISTLKEVIACFPVYRTYVTETEPVSEHDRRYIAEAVARREAARARRSPALVFDFIERLLLKQTTATDAGRVRGARAVHRQVPADHQPGRRERDRGHGALRVQPAAVAERSRRRPDAVRPRARGGARLDGGAAGGAGRRRCRRTATHDTKRGEDVRARLNVLSEIPGAWKAAVAKWRALNRRLQDRRRRRAGARAERGVSALPDAGRRVAVRDASRDPDGVPRADRRLHDQGAARSEGPHQLAEPGRGVRERRSSGSSSAILDRRRPTVPAVVRAVSGARRRARHLQQPGAAADQDHRARRARLLSGHRALGSDARRSRQPAAGRLRAAARGCWPSVTARRPRPTLLESRRDGRVKMFVDRPRARRARARCATSTSTASTCRSQTTGARRDCVFAFARVGTGRPESSRSPACRGWSRR